MNIYEFEFKETDWVFAPDKKEAIEHYLKITGMNKEDLDEYTITRVPKIKWKEMYILDTEDREPGDYNEDDYYAGLKIIMSFQDYAAQNTQTDIIATTAY